MCARCDVLCGNAEATPSPTSPISRAFCIMATPPCGHSHATAHNAKLLCKPWLPSCLLTHSILVSPLSCTPTHAILPSHPFSLSLASHSLLPLTHSYLTLIISSHPLALLPHPHSWLASTSLSLADSAHSHSCLSLILASLSFLAAGWLMSQAPVWSTTTSVCQRTTETAAANGGMMWWPL